jgi:hydroxyethylthiazole kinase-like uncharacterized protein yjeF
MRVVAPAIQSAFRAAARPARLAAAASAAAVPPAPMAAAASPWGHPALAGPVSLLSAAQAAALDVDLMGENLGFSLDQLMELAGLSVAAAVHAEHPPPRRVIVLAGPGNNGGDGLVAARHLRHFGYAVEVCSPRRPDREPFRGLVAQLRALGVPLLDAEAVLAAPLAERADVVLDALFGFSFSGAPRAPFDALIAAMAPAAAPPPVVAVDVPSGWAVDASASGALRPHTLVSLTAPKLCAAGFEGAAHFVGGRFVPPAIVEKYALALPPYPGAEQIVRLTRIDS